MRASIACAMLLGVLAAIPITPSLVAAEDPVAELLGEAAGSDADLQRSLLAHLIKLEAEGAARREGERWSAF